MTTNTISDNNNINLLVLQQLAQVIAAILSIPRGSRLLKMAPQVKAAGKAKAKAAAGQALDNLRIAADRIMSGTSPESNGSAVVPQPIGTALSDQPSGGETTAQPDAGQKTAQPVGTAVSFERLQSEHPFVQEAFNCEFKVHLFGRPGLSEEKREECQLKYFEEHFQRIRSKAMKEMQQGIDETVSDGVDADTGLEKAGSDVPCRCGKFESVCGACGMGWAQRGDFAPTDQASGSASAEGVTGSARCEALEKTSPSCAVGESTVEPMVELPDSDQEETSCMVCKTDGSQLLCNKCLIGLTEKNIGVKFTVKKYLYGTCYACKRIQNVVSNWSTTGQCEALDLFKGKTPEEKKAWFVRHDSVGILAPNLKTQLLAEYTEERATSTKHVAGYASEFLTADELQLRVDEKKIPAKLAKDVLAKATHFTDPLAGERYELRSYSSSKMDSETEGQEWKRTADQAGLQKAQKAPAAVKKAKKIAAAAEGSIEAPAVLEWPNQKKKQVDKALADLASVCQDLTLSEQNATAESKKDPFLKGAFNKLLEQKALVLDEEAEVTVCFEQKAFATWPMKKINASSTVVNARLALKLWTKSLETSGKSSK